MGSNSKPNLSLALFLATLLLFSSGVAAAMQLTGNSNAVHTSKEAVEKNGAVNDAKHPGGIFQGYPGSGGTGGFGGYPGAGNGGFPGVGFGGNPGGRGGFGGYPGSLCPYGCCGESYYGDACRCCTHAGRKVDAEPQAKPQN